MCGIVGVLNGDLSAIKVANSIISHRGDDDSGEYINHSFKIGLGHQRLSIIDTSNLGHQPMIGDDGKVVLVFNGEIYNYKELRSDLIRKGFIFKGDSDTEVLLNLYLLEGIKMLEKLNGIFAFAIWDANIKSLFVARDAFGVKPLYYYSKGGAFSFASEIKALLALMPRDRDVDVESINHYLSFLWCPGRGTPLKSVHKLLPGEAIIINDNSIVDQWLWHQTPVLNNSKIDKIVNREQIITKTAEKLRQAVHRQMVSDVPLGAFLSGGLDSSSIVAFAKEKDPNIRCFTIETKGGSDIGSIDDLPYARRVAKYLNVSLDVVSINSRKMAEDLESMVVQLDEPLADFSALNVLYISQLAREQGIKVLLSGAGGDDLFTGYRRHHAINLERYWSWMPIGLRTKLLKATKGLNYNVPIQRKISKFFNGADLDKTERLINYFRWSSDSTLQSLYSPELKERLKNSDSNKIMLDFLEPILMDTQPIDQMLALEQRFFLPDHNLNYTDKMSMAVGVETRVPFLDADLANFAATIPNKFKQKGGIGKWVLKKAMEPYLPRDVIYRPKTGFGVPLRRWIKHDLKDMVHDFLSIDSINRRGMFSAQAVQQLILDNDNGRVDASYLLLSLLCIEIWCRHYVDSEKYPNGHNFL